MFKKLFIILLFLFLLIPCVCANNEDMEILSSNDYYFDSQALDDGDGTQENPYKDLNNNFHAYSVNHLANGNYSIEDDLLISDVSFIGQDSSKTILNCHGSVFNVSKAMNLKNITLCDFTIINRGSINANNTVFQNGYACPVDKYGNSYGGAIYTPYNDSKIYTVTIDNSTFINNCAEYGGAVYMDGGVLTIINSKFINNTAYSYGGSIACEYDTCLTISRTQFFNSKSINDAGGAIYLKKSNFTANRLDFVNSSSTFGAAITSLNSIVTLSRINAYNNTAKYSGGAIYQLYGNFSIESSNFINNTALNGGGVYLDNLTLLIIASNTFENNTAFEYGGAIYSLCNPQIRFMNIFKNNTAQFYPNLYETSQINTSQIGTGNYTIFINTNTFDGAIPEYYNLNDHGYVSSIKSQELGGNCWAFSGLAALESCILKASGEEFDLSEENMKNIIELYSDYGWSMETNDGGYNNMAVGYLTSWMGPVLEINDTYDDFSTLSPLLNSMMHVQNVLYLKRDNITDNDEIKKAILKYGAVATGICYYEDYLKNNSYYYFSTIGYTNHAVTIVGWNDTYSKDNFYGKPEIDGAWIVKNSWGESWGDNGYFYVSYCDKKLAQIGLSESAYTFILNDSVRYDKNYQWDVIGKTNYFTSNDKNIWYKNVFKASDDEILSGVSTHFEKASSWDLFVYVNDILKLTQRGTVQPGYYTIKLDEYIPLKKDDNFTIVFKISGNESYSIPISEYSYSNKFLSAKNISFFSYDGITWHDLYTSAQSGVASLKAFTMLNKIKSNITISVVENQLNPVEIIINAFDEYSNPLKNTNVTLIIENREYHDVIEDGISIITHNFTKGGLNNISVFLDSDVYDSSYEFKSFNVNITNTYIAALNMEKYMENQTKYSVTLIDENNHGVGDKKVIFNINNMSYENITDSEGVACVFLNLGIGCYNLDIIFEGDLKHVKSSNSSTINVISSISLPDNAKYTYNSNYLIKVLDNSTQLILSINSKEYLLDVNDDGEVKFNINLKPASYIFKIYNPFNNETKIDKIDVIERISENKDVSIYLGAKFSYKIRIFDDYGKSAVGEFVRVTLNKKTYNLKSNNWGYIYLPITLKTGVYTVKGIYKGFEVTNKITIKSTLTANDKSYKNGKAVKFRAKLVNTNGKALKGKKITFKIKNKKFTAKTNKKGIATIKIKNLKKGKYTIISSYSKVKIKNKITIKK